MRAAMNYLNTKTGQYPITEREIRTLHPNTSFPSPFQAPSSFVLVFPSPPPAHDPIRQHVVETAPTLTEKGHYEQRWVIQDLDESLVSENLNKQMAERSALVNNERDRRINQGFEFNGVRFQSRADDRENIKGAVMIAMYDPSYSSDWIAEDNGVVRMDAPTLFAFGRTAAEHKQHLIFKARQIKDMNPIPEDFTDDKWWV